MDIPLPCFIPMNRPPTGTTQPVTESLPTTTEQPTTTAEPITTAPTTAAPTSTTYSGPPSTVEEETPETEAPFTTTTPHTTTEEAPETEDTAGPSTTTQLPPGVCPGSGIAKIAHPGENLLIIVSSDTQILYFIRKILISCQHKQCACIKNLGSLRFW